MMQVSETRLKPDYTLKRPFWYGPLQDGLDIGKILFMKADSTSSGINSSVYIKFNCETWKEFSSLNAAKLWFDVSGEDVCWRPHKKHDLFETIKGYAKLHNADAFVVQ